MLDDLHFIDNREIVKSLPVVLKRLPKAFVVLLLSRRASRQWSALGADGGAAVLDADDLRFAADEIRAYFKALGRTCPSTTAASCLPQLRWAIGVAAGQVGPGDSKDSRSLFASFFDEQVWVHVG